MFHLLLYEVCCLIPYTIFSCHPNRSTLGSCASLGCFAFCLFHPAPLVLAFPLMTRLSAPLFPLESSQSLIALRVLEVDVATVGLARWLGVGWLLVVSVLVFRWYLIMTIDGFVWLSRWLSLSRWLWLLIVGLDDELIIDPLPSMGCVGLYQCSFVGVGGSFVTTARC